MTPRIENIFRCALNMKNQLKIIRALYPFTYPLFFCPFLPCLFPRSFSLPPFSFSSFCSWNILFLLWANKFAVALCLIPFQACSCFGNRRKNPRNKSNKSPFCEEELKTEGLKEDCTWDALFWLSTRLKSETHYHNLKQPTGNTRQMVGNNPCIINK